MSNLTFCAKGHIASALSHFAKKKDLGLYHFCLMYHSIFKGSGFDDLYSLSFESFQGQVQHLIESNRNLIAFGGGNLGISITFDDGHLDNFTLAAPFLSEKKIPFTIFMISDFVSSAHKKYLNKEHLVELAQNPLVTIGAHGKTHRPLLTLSMEESKEEMRVSKLELENILGKEATTMSFPHGSFNNELLQAAKDLGYQKCGTSIPRANLVTKISTQINRHCIYSCETIVSFKQKINGKWDWLAHDNC